MLRGGLLVKGAAGVVNGPQLSIVSLPQAPALDGAPTAFSPKVIQGFQGEGAFASVEVSFPAALARELPIGFGVVRRADVVDKAAVPRRR